MGTEVGAEVGVAETLMVVGLGDGDGETDGLTVGFGVGVGVDDVLSPCEPDKGLNAMKAAPRAAKTIIKTNSPTIIVFDKPNLECARANYTQISQRLLNVLTFIKTPFKPLFPNMKYTQILTKKAGNKQVEETCSNLPCRSFLGRLK